MHSYHRPIRHGIFDPAAKLVLVQFNMIVYVFYFWCSSNCSRKSSSISKMSEASLDTKVNWWVVSLTHNDLDGSEHLECRE